MWTPTHSLPITPHPPSERVPASLQVLPYLRFLKEDPKLHDLIAGLIRRQSSQVLADPYANAHHVETMIGPSPNADDLTTYPSFGPSRTNAMVPGIFERKYELDTLCAFLKLSRSFYNKTGDKTPFVDAGSVWLDAVQTAVDVMTVRAPDAAAPLKAWGPCY